MNSFSAFRLSGSCKQMGRLHCLGILTGNKNSNEAFLLNDEQLGWECTSVTGHLPAMPGPWVQSPVPPKQKHNLKKHMTS